MKYDATTQENKMLEDQMVDMNCDKVLLSVKDKLTAELNKEKVKK